jgi:hypothetical protein
MGKAAARGSIDFEMPNIREIIGPDFGYTFFDLDLDRADLQVVVWEAGDKELKTALRMGVDLHLLNAYVLQGKEPPPLDELVETHPRYLEHRGRNKYMREFAKIFVHGTNYVGSAKTMAGHCGISVHEADRAQRLWFGAHPGIKAWHERVLERLELRGPWKDYHRPFVENRFGNRWYIFSRPEEALPEAVAWIPQSTVGQVINRVWKSFDIHLPAVEVLLQNHDALGGQFPSHRRIELLPQMKQHSRIVIPYDDPLIIPTGIKTSEISWGDCE